MNKIFIFTLMFMVSVTGFAATDPMKSLFMFQEKMSRSADPATKMNALMKLGTYYERGEGVEQSDAKALEMYKKAQEAGHPDAALAITNLQNKARQAEARERQQELEKQRAKERALAEERARKQREAEAKRLEAERARAIQDKARQDKLAKEKAEKRRQAELKAQQMREEREKAIAAQRAKELAAKKQQVKQEQQAAEDEGFKSDPCKGPAARVMSICR